MARDKQPTSANGRRPGRGASVRYSLRLKFGLLFGVLAAVVVLLPAAMQAWLQLGDARARVTDQNLALARLGTTIVEEVVQQTRESLVTLSKAPSVVTAARVGDAAVMSAYLSAAMPGDHDLTSISALDTQGRVWASSPPGRISIGTDLSSRSHIEAALGGIVPRPGPPVLGVSGHPIVGIAVPIHDERGRVVGALNGALSLYHLSEELSRIPVGEGGFINLFERDGTILTHPDTNRILQPVWYQNENVQRALVSGDSVMETRNYRGVPIFSAAVAIERLGWVVQTQIPVDEALAPFRRALLWSLSAAVAVALLALALGVRISQRLVAPIELLRSATLRIAQGDYAFPTPDVRTDDELEALAGDFDRMRLALADRTRRLDALRAVTSEISRERTVGGLLDLVMRRALDLTGAAVGTVSLWDDEREVLVPAVRIGLPHTKVELRKGEGIGGAAIARRAGLIENGYQRSPHGHDTLVRGVGVMAAMSEPLLYHDQVVGVITVGHTEAGRVFAAADLELLHLLASQVVIAIENVRHLERRERQLERQRILTRLNQLVSSALDLEAVLREIAASAAQIVAAPVVHFWIADRQARTVQLRAVSDAPGAPTVPFQVMPFGEGATGWVAEHQQAVNIPNIVEDARFTNTDWWVARGLTSYYAQPIALDAEILGVLALLSDRPFTLVSEDADLLDSFSAQAAVAMRNASLFAAEASAREAAESAARAKSDFLAMMSHEIRTPLNGVLGMNELLDGTELTDDQRTYVRHSVASGDLLLRVINDILDYSKIEAGGLTLESVPFDVREAVTSVVELFGTAARGRGLELSATVDDAVPAAVLGDAGRLKQIVMNLVGNALKFTTAGTVGVSVGVAAPHPDRPVVRFAVSDTGIGIDADAVALLFRPFAQADASITRRYGGTGLGLAISRRIVELMGGEIGVESRPGAGSTFWFTVPLGVAAGGTADVTLAACETAPFADAAPAPMVGVAHEGRPSILVVEDSPVNQAVASAMLDRLNYAATIVGTGAEAIRLLRERPFAAVLMDCHLPEMDGYETTRAIRQQEPAGRRVPILAMTADALPTTRQRCLDAGMDEYLSKPISMGVLQGMLGRWLAPDAEGTHAPNPLVAASPVPALSPTPVALLEPAPALVPGPVAVGAPSPPIDLEQIAAIAEAEPGIMDVLVEIFHDEVAACLRRLREALAADDCPEARTAAHTLKGSAATIGARPLAEVCAAAERLADQSNAADALALLPELERTAAAALQELDGLKETPAAA